MSSTITPDEVGDASNALLNWCESQGMTYDDAVRVLTTCLVAVIHELAVTGGRDAKAGGRIIADIIVESLP